MPGLEVHTVDVLNILQVQDATVQTQVNSSKFLFGLTQVGRQEMQHRDMMETIVSSSRVSTIPTLQLRLVHSIANLRICQGGSLFLW